VGGERKGREEEIMKEIKLDIMRNMNTSHICAYFRRPLISVVRN
jgi:hypothetical protein